MNDPGLHEPANEAANDIEDKIRPEDEQAEEEEDEYLDPSRWWFASTACPLIAGTFGPMANAFSICALVEKWRLYIPPGSDEGHGIKIQDPRWLIAVNSVSLVFALLANLALLLNMGRRLSFKIAQPVTILGFLLASILLIALVSVASTSAFQIQPRTEHALGQAYYYGMIAAGIYFIISALMAFTAFGAYRKHYPKEFCLTTSQRTLMLQTISFMVYLLLGALVFCKIENWNFLDGLFWADFTLLTIGLGGEFVPKTHAGRSLLFPYAIGGLVMVGLVIGSIRSLILEHGKQKIAARFVEVKREEVLKSIDTQTRTIRLGLFETIKFSQKGLSEAQKRQQEFHVMRRIQKLSETKRRWTALAISTTAALLLWFLGALVFMYAEKPQGFTYFTGLYFAYTTLLTIGYGDFTVNSNAGKAFFVFWSLLAVPTLTILISNMGDTVIKSFKDFTIWLGSLTVLPDEGGLRNAFKVGWRRIRTGKLHEEEKDPYEDSPTASSQHALDRLAEFVEEHELAEAEEKAEEGDTLQRDIHFYHFILAKEIRQLMKDVDASPPRNYKYYEWKYYLSLIGQDENDPTEHRNPKEEYHRDGSDSPDLGTADDGQKVTWSWLGIRSPLMSYKSESQWLLERLGAALEAEMGLMRSPNAKAQARRRPPPISMDDLRKHKRRSQDASNAGFLRRNVRETKAKQEKAEV